MLDLFAAAPSALRQAKLREYNTYLIERDGAIDLSDHTLAKREVTVREYEKTPPRTRQLDQAEFLRHYSAYDKRKPPSQEMLLLLALVKTNAAESYGVSRGMQQALDHALQTNDELELRIVCEESYHTRILLSSTNHYGFTVDQPYEPPSALRIMIGGIVNTPKPISRSLVLAGEILGTLLFLKFLGLAARLLKDDPETRDAIEQRLIEIATDERGHISYNRLQSGPLVLAQTRLILPAVAHTLMSIAPELRALGLTPQNVLQDLAVLSDSKRLPEAVRRQSFVA